MSVPAEILDRAEPVSATTGSTFFWPMLLLPPAQRGAMFAIYRFCREVDDIVDLPGEPAEKRARLAAWRDRIRSLYRGMPPRGRVETGLQAAIRRYGLPRAELEAVVDGVSMDLTDMRAPSLDVFRTYCRRVAGAVGLLSIHVFDRADADTERFALALGEALQSTNILRDLRADAELGRLYVPREYLLQAGVSDTLPAAALRHPGFEAACRRLANHAEACYAETEALLRRWPKRRLWSARAMMVLYRRLLDRMSARGWTEIDRPARLGKVERAAVTLRCLAGQPPGR